jgi:hypothetical protein
MGKADILTNISGEISSKLAIWKTKKEMVG